MNSRSNLTGIAQRLKIYTSSGSFHGRAIAAILKHLGITPSFTKQTINKIDNWLALQGYPKQLVFPDGTKFNVKYLKK